MRKIETLFKMFKIKKRKKSWCFDYIYIFLFFFDLLLKSVQEIISFKILHINCLKIKL